MRKEYVGDCFPGSSNLILCLEYSKAKAEAQIEVFAITTCDTSVPPNSKAKKALMSIANIRAFLKNY
jgi:hypothetical protein